MLMSVEVTDYRSSAAWSLWYCSSAIRVQHEMASCSGSTTDPGPGQTVLHCNLFNLLFKMNLWREVDVGVVVDKFAKKTLSGILKRIIKCYVKIYKF